MIVLVTVYKTPTLNAQVKKKKKQLGSVLEKNQKQKVNSKNENTSIVLNK